MINTSTVKTTNNTAPSRFLEPGQFKVKINNINARQASTGSYKLEFQVETEPVNEPGFTPAEGYSGRVGTVKTPYLGNPDLEAQAGALIANLADELGVREEVNNFSQDLTYPEYCEKLLSLVKDKYVYLSINGKEYINTGNGKVGMELQFPKFRAWASVEKVDKVGLEKALSKTYVKQLPKPESTQNEVLF